MDNGLTGTGLAVGPVLQVADAGGRIKAGTVGMARRDVRMLRTYGTQTRTHLILTAILQSQCYFFLKIIF